MSKEVPPDVTSEQYARLNERRFGSRNPERVENPVWEWMARTYANPYRVRGAFGVDSFGDQPPGWCVLRHGMPGVLMPDGRRISIAGEHEDHYDPEFCIYNDVIVRKGDEVEIYAYPRDVFPPTDFHTATLVGETIWLIGTLGYPEDRVYTRCQVMCLDTKSYEITTIEACGDAVGQLFKHRARPLEDGVTIEVRGGQHLLRLEEKELGRPNTSVYRFDTRSCEWSVAGDATPWRRFVFTSSDECSIDLDDVPEWETGEILRELPYELHPAWPREHDEDFSRRVHTLIIDEVPVCIVMDFDELRVDVEGDLAQHGIGEVLRSLRDRLRRSGFDAPPPEEQPFEPVYHGM